MQQPKQSMLSVEMFFAVAFPWCTYGSTVISSSQGNDLAPNWPEILVNSSILYGKPSVCQLSDTGDHVLVLIVYLFVHVDSGPMKFLDRSDE